MTDVAAAITQTRERIAKACALAGRDAGDVRLMLATKTVHPERLRQAIACGEYLFGENRVQELAGKAQALADVHVEWHMIGHLQTNKVKAALEVATCIQSVDRLSLVQELHRQCERLGRMANILVEVNVSGEASKHGCAPANVDALLEAIAALPTLRVGGFMTIGANTDDERVVRHGFSQLRRIAHDARSRGLVPASATVLSMGMSSDMEWAIAEGSTMVRVGSAVFGERMAG